MAQFPILVVSHAGAVYGLDSSTGETRWKHRVTDRPGSFPVEIIVEGGVVFACSEFSNKLCCIAYPGGELLGEAKLQSTKRVRPVMLVNGETILVARDAQVECFDRRGRQLWHMSFQGQEAFTSPIALGVPGNVRQADDKGDK